MVQRNPQGEWEATGAAGRVAHPQKVVTNGSQGGTIYPVETLLKAYTRSGKRKPLLAQMYRLGVKCAIQLSSAYPGLKEIGLDLALDRRLTPWILEVNTAPRSLPVHQAKGCPDAGPDRKIRQSLRAYLQAQVHEGQTGDKLVIVTVSPRGAAGIFF
ncbi:YheC/YheD family protein [Paenibacillus rhizoplanae]